MNKSILIIFGLFTFTLLCFSCSENDMNVKGVSKLLAEHRKKNISNVEYELFFDIPKNKQENIYGISTVLFTVDEVQDVVLDFKISNQKIGKGFINNEQIDVVIIEEHIIIPEKYIQLGKNNFTLHFDGSNVALNRRSDFMYTRFFPDIARALFPCFEQPDLKALFSLELSIPDSWKAASAGAVCNIDTLAQEGKVLYTFQKTELMSTFMFSFIAGEFNVEKFNDNGREIKIYHREVDSLNINQFDDIAKDAFRAIEWMEEYTGIDFPFQKYDMAILSGLQFSSMESVGLSLFNSSSLFLTDNCTLTDKADRCGLISNNIALSWFGNFVTVKWFDDIWKKNAISSYYELIITSEFYPKLGFEQQFVERFVNAYSEDRTMGTNPVSHELDNIDDTKLFYGSIAYDKTAVLFLKLVDIIGVELFQLGIREFLNSNSYGNASWDDMIDVMSNYTSYSLMEWSQIWTQTKGMPTVETGIENDSLFIVQNDPFNRDIKWIGHVKVLAVGDDFKIPIKINVESISCSIALPKGTKYIIPNYDMMSYGFFLLDSQNIQLAIDSISTFKDPITKASILINLHENMLNYNICPEVYLNSLMEYIPTEHNSLLYSMAIDNFVFCLNKFQIEKSVASAGEEFLWSLAEDDEFSHRKKYALHKIITGPNTTHYKSRLLDLFSNKSMELISDINESISLSYVLAIISPEYSEEIIKEQLMDIKNPYTLKEYLFVSRAISSSQTIRDILFEDLLKVENRQIEPWAIKALSLLNHPARQTESLKYIRPALDILPEINKTGGVLFSEMWIEALLWGHDSVEAIKIIEEFILDNEDIIHPMLINELKQQTYSLYIN